MHSSVQINKTKAYEAQQNRPEQRGLETHFYESNNWRDVQRKQNHNSQKYSSKNSNVFMAMVL